MKKLAAGLIALAVLTGCSGKLEAKEIETNATLHKLGDTISIDGVKYTVKDITEEDSSEYYTPESGNKLYYCMVEAENTSNEPADVGTLQWTMFASEGDPMPPLDIVFDDPSLITNDDLLPGDSAKGYIVFEGKPDTEMVLYPPINDLEDLTDAWLIQDFYTG